MLNIWVFAGLFLGLCIGIRMLFHRPFLKKLMGFSLLGHTINLLIILSGTTPPQENLLGRPPFVESGLHFNEIVDPLPQALVLTAIVISFAFTAFLVVFYLLAERDHQQ